MRLLRRRRPRVGVVVPAYGVERWLPECLASLVAQEHREWEAVVVDDGSPDRSGEVAEEWAHRDPRIRVVHTPNGGLGAARNAGVRHLSTDLLAFLDADDVLPPTAYRVLVDALESSGSDFAAGSMQRWEDGRLTEPGWMARTHRPPLRGARIEDRPLLLGDVFAWDKLFRRSFWESAGLSWPEGVSYEDQPTTTRAFLAGRFDVLPDVVYHWRIRTDGSSLTQQRASVPDLADRWATKRWSLDSVRAHGDPALTDVFLTRVLPGDLWRYFLEIPGCPDEWWDLLVAGVRELWGERSLVASGLNPVHRLCGWLVEQDRREDATRVAEWVRGLDGPAPRVEPGAVRPDGRVHDGPAEIVVPPEVLDTSTVDPAALSARPGG